MREKRVDRRGLGTETWAIGVRKASAACNCDSICKPCGSPVSPEELRPAPGEGVYSWFVTPQAGRVPLCVTVGKDVEEAQELRMNPARGMWSLVCADSGLAQREGEAKHAAEHSVV